MSIGADEIRALLFGVVGRACWSVMTSGRTDYVVVLDLGEKMRRSLRLANPRLSFLQRTYEGEYSFLIECNWRLDGPNGVVVSCYDAEPPRAPKRATGGAETSAARSSPMLDGLMELEGRRVTAVRAEHAAYDLTIDFEDGYALRCLSTETDLGHHRGNWSFWSPNGLVTIGPRGKVETETHPEATRRLHALKRKLAEDEDGPIALPRGKSAKEGEAKAPEPPRDPRTSPGDEDDDAPVTIIDDE